MATLSEAEITQGLKGLKDWNHDGQSIVKKFKFPGFPQAIEFVTKVAKLAEEVQHHPTIIIAYNRVTLAFTTHSEGGLTEKDFQVAGRIEGLLSTIK
ncbi:MAG TPA: 4a-hydroxytetrahydrobiopterin dehydratase [Candidatus Hypogeohydataceae bacterium YC41]